MQDDARKPQILATVGGAVDETRLTLSIHGDDLDPDEISRILGCAPSRSHRRGDPRSPRLPPWEKGAWLLTVECQAPIEPEHLLQSLLDRLPDDPAIWDSLRARYEARLDFGVFQGAWNRGFSLSPEILKRVAALGFGLGFDIYMDGEDYGEITE